MLDPGGGRITSICESTISDMSKGRSLHEGKLEEEEARKALITHSISGLDSGRNTPFTAATEPRGEPLPAERIDIMNRWASWDGTLAREPGYQKAHHVINEEWMAQRATSAGSRKVDTDNNNNTYSIREWFVRRMKKLAWSNQHKTSLKMTSTDSRMHCNDANTIDMF
jgi:hypothetical protein